MKTKELEDEVPKQKQEMWQQKFEDQKQSYEMTLQKLMEKLEEERKQILEEQEKMIQRTLKEELAAFGCCCCCKKSVRGAQEEKDHGGLPRELSSDPLISLERRCISSSKARMEAPVCLIENRKNRLHVSPEAFQLLSDIRQPVVVVSIVGLYRTGKSYLMNKLAGKNSGFSLGSTVQAKTKGIWMWCVPYPDRPNQTLVLLDTEGLGDVEKGSSQNDTWIFALAVLLSSTLVYNSVGTIDQTALDKLHFVTELSEHIKAKASSSPEDTDDSSEFVGFFPTFVWSVRDFALQLERDGKPITEDEYLEHALELKKGNSKKKQMFNLPRKCIRLFFPTRKCFVFDCPTKSRNLPYLEKMVDNQLEPEFVEQAKKFCFYIFAMSQEKTLPGGHVVTGN
ncbi:PREDICTED: interferon-induced guanylate-binding protein 1-like, partial [Thamnophis sirtalis]|uniref:Interferon-induced guanylate-binding protein 1-like n=1 Tax=Thamnophis sirtalis TaxID=35019 RepID=A0A6I9Z4B8_9SAUR